MKISRILHAGYVFECAQTKIAFDPIFENPFSQNCYAFPDVKFDHAEIRNLQFDAVFISHYHDDHCSFESLALLDRSTPIYIYCIFEELFSLVRELGFVSVFELRINLPVQIGSFEVIPRRALDTEVDSIFHIKAGGLNVLNVVDAWIDESTLDLLTEFSPWDVVLWPFQTMREMEVVAPTRAAAADEFLPFEWIEQIRKLYPRYLVPSSCQFRQESWSWYNHALFPVSYRQFQKEIEIALPETKVFRLNPSVGVKLNKKSIEYCQPLAWVVPIGEQEVDYEYHSTLQPQPTLEIARHFPALSPVQMSRILEYCRSEIVEKFSSLQIHEISYFREPKLWSLCLFDHAGNKTQFFYILNQSKIELIENSEMAVSWHTEIPVYKLYSALEFGEALTSLYLRVNDFTFEPRIEVELKAIDILQDPLICCLYSGDFALYQKAQLKKIKKSTSLL